MSHVDTLPAGYRTEAEATRRLRQLEAAHDLFSHAVDGYAAWPLLRFAAAIGLQNMPFTASPGNGKWHRLAEWLTVGLQDLPTLLFPQRARYVVKTFRSALSEKESGSYKDIYFDDLLKEIAGGPGQESSCFKIEGLNNPLFSGRHRSAFIPIAMTTATIDLLANLLSLLSGPASISAVGARIATITQTEQSLQFLTSQRITRVLRRFYWSKRLFKWLLRRVRPEYVLVANTSEFAIWAAARELGIKTVSLQHGIFTRNHPDVLPAEAAPYRASLIVPDKMLVYGEYWRRELKANGFCAEELQPVGNIRVERFRKVRADYLAYRQDKTCRLVLTTQGLDRERLIDFMAEFCGLAQGRLSYTLYIKLHPFYEVSKTPYVTVLGANPHVKVLSGAEDPSTFDLLARSDIHLSIASACHYDALGLGVPTMVLPLAGHEIVLHLVEAGHACLTPTARELLDQVIELREQREAVPPDVSAHYFAPDAMQNIKRELGLLP